MAFSTDGDDGVWRGRYDAWGRLYSEQPPASAFLERAFDRSGALTRATAFEDASKATTLAETAFTTTSFGAVSESRELVSGGGSPSTTFVTTRTFDGAGRTVDVKRGPTGSLRLEQHLTYEPDTGRTLTVTDTMGNETRFVHAGATPWPSSIVTTEPAAGAQPAITTTTALTYDAFGRVVHEDLGGTLIDRTFDESGNLLATSTGGIDRVASTVDGYGLLLTTGRPDVGQRVDHGYDTDGRLLVRAVLRESGATEATTFHYDATGRLDTRTRPGSLPESFTYNDDDTLKTWTTRLASTSGQQLVLSLRLRPGQPCDLPRPRQPRGVRGREPPGGPRACGRRRRDRLRPAGPSELGRHPPAARRHNPRPQLRRDLRGLRHSRPAEDGARGLLARRQRRRAPLRRIRQHNLDDPPTRRRRERRLGGVRRHL